MQFLRRTLHQDKFLAGVAMLGLLSLLSLRLSMPKHGLDGVGRQTWAEIAFLLVLYLYLGFSALGLGRILIRCIQLPSLTSLESTLLACILGLSFLSVGLMVLGLLGWLTARVIFTWLAISGVLAGLGLGGMNGLAGRGSLSKGKDGYLAFVQIIAAIGILLLFMECLLPVWDYDALLYHLEVPRQFLAQGKIYFDPEVLRSGYPYLGEMLFVAGIVFDLDSLAKLINFTYAALFVLSAYAFSRRFFGSQAAYTTSAILIGAPAFWMWATWAGIDFAWASYEFWSVYIVSLWLLEEEKNTGKHLMLAGGMSGLAASTKYLSIPTLLILAGLIAWKSLQYSKRSVKVVFSNLLTFGLAAALVAGAWYMRNWVTTGNPVYPLIFGGPGWEPLENQVLNDYVYSFGVGKDLWDFLLLPYNVYAFQNKFSTIGLEIIHPVLWLGFLFPVAWKAGRKYDLIFLYAILMFFVWAFNSQVIRFLIPLTAFLAILSACVIETFSALWKNLFRIGLIGGFMLFNVLFQLAWLQQKDSLAYLRGEKSASEYLEDMNYDFPAMQYIQTSLDVDERALFLWDGRSYYCDARCVPDDEQSTAVRLAVDSPPPERLAGDLRENGVTHILLSRPDASWFIAHHDPRNLHHQSLNYFTSVFFPVCGKLLYSDYAMQLYELTCQ